MESISAVCTADDITAVRNAMTDITVSGEMEKYIVQLVAATRKSQNVTLGASPRASLALMRMARAYAFLRGRDFVLAEDVAALYTSVVAHRIVLSQEARMERMSPTDVTAEIMRTVEVPYRSGR